MPNDYFYKAYGLTIKSYRRIPSLISECKPQSVDVDVQPATLEKPSNRGRGRRSVSVHKNEVVIHWKDWVTLSMREGDKILVDQVPDSDDRFTQLLIAGTGLGVILHQMKRLTLHASAIATDQGAVGFLGHKGMGKSTTAVGMMKRGYPLITDDILTLKVSDNKIWTAPGERIFKLRPDAASDLIGSGDQDLHSLYENSSKKAGLIPEQFASEIPLCRIYILEFDDSTSESLPRIEPLRPSDAYIEIIKNSYPLRFLGRDGLGEWHVSEAAKIVKKVPIYRFIRGKDRKEAGKSIISIKKHLSKKESNENHRPIC